MASLEFSVPYNNNPDALEEIFRLKRLGKNMIREIYLSGPQKYSGSGRRMPQMNDNEFVEIVDKIHNEGIRVNLVFNSTCEGSDWYSPEVMGTKMEFLRQIHEKNGVEAITIANPIYIREVRRHLPDVEICASVLGDIDCVEKAVQFSRAGANVITPDVNINRDLKLLKEIKEATGAELKLMLNEGCLYKCAFRKFHFNLTSHKSKEIGADYWALGVAGDDCYADFFGDCLQRTAMDYSQILKSCWIRPEDARKYSEITSFFKIVGRCQPRGMVIRTTKAYLEESWAGDIFDILCASLKRFSLVYGAYIDNKSLENYGFFEKVISCDKRCSQCSYCDEVTAKLVNFGVVTPERLDDMGLKV